MVNPLITKVKSEALELTLEEIYRLSGLRFHDFLKRIRMSTKNYGRYSNTKFKYMSKSAISRFNYLDTVETVNPNTLFPLLVAQAKELARLKDEMALMKKDNIKLSNEINTLKKDMQISISSQNTIDEALREFKRGVLTIADETSKIVTHRITPHQEKILDKVSEEEFNEMTVQEIRELLRLSISEFLELIDRSRSYYHVHKHTKLNDLSRENAEFFKDIKRHEKIFITKDKEYDILSKPLSLKLGK